MCHEGVVYILSQVPEQSNNHLRNTKFQGTGSRSSDKVAYQCVRGVRCGHFGTFGVEEMYNSPSRTWETGWEIESVPNVRSCHEF